MSHMVGIGFCRQSNGVGSISLGAACVLVLTFGDEWGMFTIMQFVDGDLFCT